MRLGGGGFFAWLSYFIFIKFFKDRTAFVAADKFYPFSSRNFVNFHFHDVGNKGEIHHARVMAVIGVLAKTLIPFTNDRNIEKNSIEIRHRILWRGRISREA